MVPERVQHRVREFLDGRRDRITVQELRLALPLYRLVDPQNLAQVCGHPVTLCDGWVAYDPPLPNLTRDGLRPRGAS